MLASRSLISHKAQESILWFRAAIAAIKLISFQFKCSEKEILFVGSQSHFFLFALTRAVPGSKARRSDAVKRNKNV